MADLDLYDSGIGFVVPADQVFAAVDRLKQGADLQPGRLGVSLVKAATLDAPAVVAHCRPNADAYRQGVRPGDRIAAIDSLSIDRQVLLGEALAGRYAGDTVSVTVDRDGESRDIAVKLMATIEPYEPPLLGILPTRAPQSLDTGDRDGGDTADSPSGVVIRRVLENSPAAMSDIRPGDTIVAFAGTEVASPAELRAQFERQRVGDTVVLTIVRDGERLVLEPTLVGGASTITEEDLAAETTGERAVADGNRADDKNADESHTTDSVADLAPLVSLDIPGLDAPVACITPVDVKLGGCGLIVVVNAPANERPTHADQPDTDQSNNEPLTAPATEALSDWNDIAAHQRWVVASISVSPSPNSEDAIGQITQAIEHLHAHFGTSADRTVIAAQGDTALLTWQTATQRSGLCRGVMVIRPAAIGPVNEQLPGQTFGIFLSVGADNPLTVKRAEAVVNQLREWKYSVTTAMDAAAGVAAPIAPNDEMVRWLDLVDRL
ncbi:MAG: PDZ domain-containing protein [Pirellulales bacterium]